MSLADALHDWKQLATTSSELSALKKQVAEMQTSHDRARMQLEEGLEELEEDERQSILSIMAIYEQSPAEEISVSGPPETPSAKSVGLEWLVNKIGNEGSEGISWGDIADAWQTQYADTPTSAIYETLNLNNNLFVKKGMGTQAVLKLTGEGQSMFLGGN
jgi:hypothetical protein